VEQIEAFYPPWGRWFENRIFPADDGIAIFFQDVTERRAREEERRRLACIADATSDLVALVSPDGSLQYLNPSGRRLLGVDPVGHPARTFADVHGTSGREARDALAVALACGEWSGEMTVRASQGSTQWSPSWRATSRSARRPSSARRARPTHARRPSGWRTSASGSGTSAPTA
jgi:PAS domain-containing protein